MPRPAAYHLRQLIRLRCAAAGLFAMLTFPLLGSASAVAEQRPNILLIVIDDMGYGDLSAHGHPWLKTPNLDRFHAQSVRMADFMVCVE